MDPINIPAQELTNQQLDYIDSFAEPVEFDFLTADQKKSLELEAAKLNKSIKHYKIAFGDTNWEENIDKDILKGDVYTVQQALVVADKIKARNWYGERTEINKSLVSPTGQRAIMSKKCSDDLGLYMDSFVAKDSIDQLVNVLKEEGIGNDSIERIKSAANKYGVIVLQNGIFAALKPLLDDLLSRKNNVSIAELAQVEQRPNTNFQPQVPRPVQPQAPAPQKDMTAFEKKLAAVTAAPAHGQDLEALRRQMEPKNTFVQKPPVPPPSKPAGPAPLRMTPDEIKREVRTQELSEHKEPVKPVFKPTPPPPAPKLVAPVPSVSPNPNSVRQDIGGPEPVRRFDQTPYLTRQSGESSEEKMGVQSLDKISVVDDLKKVDISILREGPVTAQTQGLRSKILNLAKANKILPYYTVSAFEQSPLFQSYLQIGSAIIMDNNADRATAFKNAASRIGSQLTFQEFEAIADLKKEIEGL